MSWMFYVLFTCSMTSHHVNVGGSNIFLKRAYLIIFRHVFSQLPFYIDDDVKLTESNAILRYLARKHDLAGSSEEEWQRIDIAQGVLYDQFLDLVKLVFRNDNFVSLWNIYTPMFLNYIDEMIENFSYQLCPGLCNFWL